MLTKTWQEQLQKRYNYNKGRITVLIAHAKVVEPQPLADDILRAATVLLHATLEDVLRTVQIRKLSGGDEKQLSTILIEHDGEHKVEKYSLGMLRRLSGRDIDDFITERVTAHFNHRSYSNKRDLADAAKMIGVKPKIAGKRAAMIAPLMERRHQIVHQGDRDPLGENHFGRRKKISPVDIELWIRSVDSFVQFVLQQALKIK